MNVLLPVRVRREHTHRLVGPPDAAFPMLCPVREVEWVSEWDPYVVFSNSGVAEPDCVFVTRDGENESIWVITHHDPESYRLEMVKITPGLTAAKLEFALEADGEKASKMHVAYSHTALSREGRKFVADFDEERWAGFMDKMGRELNHYLGSGESPAEAELRYE
jgi:hypothetical protein